MATATDPGLAGLNQSLTCSGLSVRVIVQVHTSTHTTGAARTNSCLYVLPGNGRTVLPARLWFMGSPRPARRSPKINGLAALRQQGYGLFRGKDMV